MNTITIEKGKVAFYSSLSTDTLVVNGVLKVRGDLKVRRLLGNGIVDARRLEAETVNLRTGFIREVEIGSGTFGELYGTTCKARRTLCVRNFIQALEVSAKRLVVNRSNIGNCSAKEVISLRRYLPNRLLTGLQRLFTAPFRWLIKPSRRKTPEEQRMEKQMEIRAQKVLEVTPESDSELVSSILETLRANGYTISRIQEPEVKELAA